MFGSSGYHHSVNGELWVRSQVVKYLRYENRFWRMLLSTFTRARVNWKYCWHVPECIVTTKPDGLVSLSIVIWHSSLQSLNIFLNGYEHGCALGGGGGGGGVGESRLHKLFALLRHVMPLKMMGIVASQYRRQGMLCPCRATSHHTCNFMGGGGGGGGGRGGVGESRLHKLFALLRHVVPLKMMGIVTSQYRRQGMLCPCRATSHL